MTATHRHQKAAVTIDSRLPVGQLAELCNNAAEVRHEVARCEWARRREGRRMMSTA
jgi:hypothetical protein